MGTIKFTYEELARLNEMIGVSLVSGKIELDDPSVIHRSNRNKTARESCIRVFATFLQVQKKRRFSLYYHLLS